MKKKISLIAVIVTAIVAIATFSILSSATGIELQEMFSYKHILSEMLNNKTISKEDKEEMNALFSCQQWFDNSSDITCGNTQLNNNYDSYNTIVKYLIKLIDNEPERDCICLGVDGCSKDNIILWDAAPDGDVLNVTQEVLQALCDIKQSFSNMGYYFDTIVIENGTILFDTIDGQYALIYMFDNKATLNKDDVNKDSGSIIESSKDKWYHRIST